MRKILEIGYYAAGIVVAGVALVQLYERIFPCPEPSLPNCVVYSEDRQHCARCEFDISERPAQHRLFERTCFAMPPSEKVAVQFVGSYFVTNRGNGSDCWLDNVIRRADGTTDKAKHRNVASCRVDASRSTGFFKPKDSANVTGAFQIAQCQWGGKADRNCELNGTLSIFTRRGQK